MSMQQILKAAIEPIVPVCLPDFYDGEKTEYCTFNAVEIPRMFSDDAPEQIVHQVQLHWFLPTGQNPNSKKKQIRSALVNAGFAFPTVTNASDSETQHYVFEFEWMEGVV